MRQWRLRNADRIKTYSKKYYHRDRIAMRKKVNQYYADNKDTMLSKHQLYYQKNKEHLKFKNKEHYQAMRTRVLTHYGNCRCACVRCGESRLACLSIDHINGDGMKHRKELGGLRGNSFYLWLIRQGFPKGLQTLCMNCQFVKRAEENEYPHQQQSNLENSEALEYLGEYFTDYRLPSPEIKYNMYTDNATDEAVGKSELPQRQA
jgi:hypothetical protein